MKVSIITPTFGREDRLASLYRRFAQQTHDDKELLIFDDSGTPSSFIQDLDDARVRYIYTPSRVIIGAKRDRLVREARGDVIVQFDDDDYYAPHYVETMVRELEGHDLVKLGTWFLVVSSSREFFYWDTTEVSSIHFRVACGEAARPMLMDLPPDVMADWLDRNLWGYGFSYVFRKSIYDTIQFDTAMDRKQDYAFVAACRRAGLKLRAIPDAAGLALHVIHDSNTSRAFPNYRVPACVIPALFGPEISGFLADGAEPLRQ